jgi:hypothetical protein
LVALSVKGGIVFAPLSTSGNRLAALLAVCMVAGASERFVPSLIERVDKPGVDQPDESE